MKTFYTTTTIHIAAAILLASASPETLMANSIYSTNVNYTDNVGGTASLTGTITTDGHTGSLTASDIVAINWVISVGGVPAAATKLNDIQAQSELTLTTSGNNLLLAPGPNSNVFDLYSDNLSATTGNTMYIAIVNQLEQVEFYGLGGSQLALDQLTNSSPATVVLGTLAPTPIAIGPEPASVGLMAAAGIALIGCRKLRRSRKA